MENLKIKTLIAFFAILLSTNVTTAQTFDETLKAFKTSYVSEYKADYKTAINDIQAVYKSDSYECNLRMGWLHYSAKNYEKALEYYQKAIDVKKYSVEARLGYIAPAKALKKYTEVYNMYEEILRIDPYNSIANYYWQQI